jgi:hypothetical protein
MKDIDLKERKRFMLVNIERVVTNLFPESYSRSLRNELRNANGVLGDDFLMMPMPDKERRRILNDLFGKEGW